MGKQIERKHMLNRMRFVVGLDAERTHWAWRILSDLPPLMRRYWKVFWCLNNSTISKEQWGRREQDRHREPFVRFRFSLALIRPKYLILDVPAEAMFVWRELMRRAEESFYAFIYWLEKDNHRGCRVCICVSHYFIPRNLSEFNLLHIALSSRNFDT